MTCPSGWGYRIDFDSDAPIAPPPQDRSDTALPQEPFKLPLPRTSPWLNQLLKFEDDQPSAKPKKDVRDWPRYYIVRAYPPENYVDTTSDEPLKMPRFKPVTALPQTLQIPRPEIHRSVFMDRWNEVFDRKLSYSKY